CLFVIKINIKFLTEPFLKLFSLEPCVRLPRAHREPPRIGKSLRGLAGTLFPQASHTLPFCH
ncbi:hypothetical protein, partial [Sporolactobacillus spathodeae]|uniref:hypothetical protein n=1 Tax=Sporolactobacillus spathodeae TaxID=1465502 RepID=UPI001961D17F